MLRLTPEQKSLLEQAAAVSGRTVTDIVTAGARTEALGVLREADGGEGWRLSRADATAFVEALLASPPPTERMVQDYRDYLASRATRFVPAASGDEADLIGAG